MNGARQEPLHMLPTTPVSTSHAQSPSRCRVSLRHRGAVAVSATSSAADAALRQVIDRRHARRLGIASPADAAPAERVFGSSASGRRGPEGKPASRHVAWAVALAGTAAVLWLAVTGIASVGFRGRDSGGCGFAGTVVFDGRPLAQAVIEFHPLEPGQAPRALPIETDTHGQFTRTEAHGVAPGRYAVVVKSGCVMPRPDAEVGRPVAIPPRYVRVDSTPLQVAVAPAARFELVLAR